MVSPAFLSVLLIFYISVCHGYKYLGCHKDSPDDRLLSESETVFADTLTIEVCMDHCKSSGYRYAGVQYKVECFCSNKRVTYKTLVDEEDCSQECAGNSAQKCGGGNRLNVYDTSDEVENAVVNNYLGCYTDNPEEFTLKGYKGWSSLLTPELCVGSCYRKGFSLAGMEYGRECFCGDTLTRKKKASSADCSINCDGDNNFKCGGNWRLSVYRTVISANPLDENGYLGCFNDNNENLRLLSGLQIDFSTTNTPEKCMNLCLSEGFKYSGTQYGKECFCGNLKPPKEKQISESKCRMPCPGDSSAHCGGEWSLLIYSTGSGRVKPIFTELEPENPDLPLVDPVTTSRPTPSTCTTSETTVKGKAVCKGEVIFKEDFNSLDSRKWTPSIFIPWIPDYEFSIFSGKPQNTYVKDGKLFIKPSVLDEATVLRGRLIFSNCTGSQYTEECERQASSFNIIPPIESGRLNTMNSFSFKYGTVTIRAKLPAGDWIVPNLWLEPSGTKYGRGDANGRIMVALIRGNAKLTLDGQNIGSNHLEYGMRMGVGEKIKLNKLSKDRSQPWSSQFHDFTLNWKPSGLSFKVDNDKEDDASPAFGTSMCDLLDFSRDECTKWSSGSSLAPFDQEFHLTLGLSVGGMRDFPDSSMTGTTPKPWKNWGVKALVNFWKAKGDWLPTWRGDDSALQVESITVTAL